MAMLWGWCKGWPPHMEYLKPFFLLMLMMWPIHARADIRCYCNAASCISTGYMCKSTSGRCFSQLTHQGDHTHSAHGCAELLPLPDRKLCEGDDDVIKTRSSGGDWPVLLCCQDDMCNYMDNLDINIYVDTKSNGSVLKDRRPNQRGTSTEYRMVGDDSREGALWFKAAVIAVPIAGGFILLLLVVLAVRLLRNDGHRHRQLLARRRHRSLAKAQLYVADHFCDKHAHFNHVDSCKHNNIYKEVNVTRADGRGYEKIHETPHGGSCNSIIVWGKSGKLDPASAV